MAGRLEREVFSDLRVGLLHGRMAGPEKDAVMEEFRAGRIHVLVSTTVIEVGIDVPNASVMVVEHAGRFGLSQLHQLRGGSGGPWKSRYCILMRHAPSEDARRPLDAMAETNDGFRLAEVDLGIRGPGVLRHAAVSLPAFRVADLLDAAVPREARQEALTLASIPTRAP
jgi:ATP-dependent DNA helicase RecG